MFKWTQYYQHICQVIKGNYYPKSRVENNASFVVLQRGIKLKFNSIWGVKNRALDKRTINNLDTLLKLLLLLVIMTMYKYVKFYPEASVFSTVL